MARGGGAGGSHGVSSGRRLTVAAALIHFLKANVGPGCLSMPFAYEQAGLALTTALVLFVGFANLLCVYLLLDCQQFALRAMIKAGTWKPRRLSDGHILGSTTAVLNGDVDADPGCAPPTTAVMQEAHEFPPQLSTYGGIAGACLGPWARHYVDGFLVATQTGVCCVFVNFVATNVHATVPDAEASTMWLSKTAMIVALIPIVVAFSLCRLLKAVTPLSSSGNVFLSAALLFAWGYLMQRWVTGDGRHWGPSSGGAHRSHTVASAAEADGPAREPAELFIWAGMPQAFGTAMYSLEGIGAVMAVKSSMLDERKFRWVCGLTFVTIVALFIATGVVGYLGLPVVKSGSITASIEAVYGSKGRVVATVLNVVTSAAVLVTYPLQLYVAVEILEWKLFGLRPPLDAPASRGKAESQPLLSRDLSDSHDGSASAPSPWPTVMRVGIALFTVAVAASVHNLGDMISLFGAMGSSSLGLIIPPLCYVNVHPTRTWRHPACVVALCVCALGAVGAVTGTIQSIQKIVS